MLLRPWDRGPLLCGLVECARGSQEVTHFAVFLLLQGVGDDGTLRSSIQEDMASFETLNSKVPSLSEVTYERRIWEGIAS